MVYAANVRVGSNIGSLDEMMRLAMPDAAIQATPMNNLVLLTGTVASPGDVEEAQRLVQAYVGDRHAGGQPAPFGDPAAGHPPVKIAEVNRSLRQADRRQPAVSDSTSGFQFGIGQGDRHFGPPADRRSTPAGQIASSRRPGPTLGLAGNLFGLDICRARPGGSRRAGDDARRTEPDRAFG